MPLACLAVTQKRDLVVEIAPPALAAAGLSGGQGQGVTNETPGASSAVDSLPS
jgi:hypothetical protein